MIRVVLYVRESCRRARHRIRSELMSEHQARARACCNLHIVDGAGLRRSMKL